VRARDGAWRTLGVKATQLAGGQGTAVLPTENDQPRGVLGSGEGEEGIGRRDRYLPEIAALLDPKQFDAIARPAAGVVVIQGGAGSGKTTIGLHRIAYLAFHAPKRFTPDKVVVVVPSRALAVYTSRVLPALEVPHVGVVTMHEWQRDARLRAFPTLPARTTDETPSAAIKLKKHPSLLVALDARIDALVVDIDARVRAACASVAPSIGRPIVETWDLLRDSPVAGRLTGMRKWLGRSLRFEGAPQPPIASPERLVVEQTITRQLRRARDVVSIWADLLTDRSALDALLQQPATPGLAALTRADIDEAHRWCTRRCEAVISRLAGQTEDGEKPLREARENDRKKPAQRDLFEALGDAAGSLGEDGEEKHDDDAPEPRDRRDDFAAVRASDYDDDDRDYADDHKNRDRGVDGSAIDEETELGPALDAEDDALFLRLHQRLRGPLHGRGKSTLSYEHVFVDEVQDCAAIDLAVLVECTNLVGGERSMTLAGDSAQRLTLDTGLGDFAPALRALGLPHVEVEPLTIGYRSTRQVLELAREILGPLAPETPPIATREGVPVERHVFGDPSAAAAFLAGALRDLLAREPMASVALITRFPWQADVYFDVFSKAEIASLRRVAHQDFPFRAGVDLTDVKQVKGLEWDYVVLLDVNANVYGADDEARHLLHIAATRAAHQLWLIATADPSPLVGNWEP
jgi:DNA helicase-2/ATP-dependent DNA helicase PcrA